MEWFSEKNIKFFNFDRQSQRWASQNKKGWKENKAQTINLSLNRQIHMGCFVTKLFLIRVKLGNIHMSSEPLGINRKEEIRT